MMHETKNPSVKGYIDLFIYENDSEIYLEGWCFHIFFPDCEIRLKYFNDETEEILYNNSFDKTRKDVVDSYNKPEIINCGWKFMVKKKSEKMPINFQLEMMFENTWNLIFTFEKYEKKDRLENNIIKKKHYIPSFVVIDHFYENPDSIRKYALSQEFSYHPEYHKGKRTNKTFRFDGLKENFEDILGNKIKNWDYYTVNGCFQYCISGDQLVYHRDGQEYAGILFLTPDAPPQSGTSFYRSKHTKKNKTENDDEFNIVFKNGFLDSTEFEVVDVVGNMYNRLVLFDAQMIHAASTYFGNTLENGRLFQLFFFDLEKI